MNQKKMAEYAYQKVPFYNNLCDKPVTTWEDYPIIDKKMVLENKDSLFSPEYMMQYLNGQLERVVTSGSTGECLEIFWEKGQNIKSLIPLWKRRKEYYGILPNDKRCYFFSNKIYNGKDMDFEETETGLGFNKLNLTEEKIIKIYNRIVEFSPTWMIVQPSVILLFINILSKKKIKQQLSLKYIELTGERVTLQTKNTVKKFFDCKVASQYGCYEINSIAYECPCGNMHIVSENVFIESVGQNELCVTSLHNKVMPFVRYKLGDRGQILTDKKCLCGSREPVVELNMARDNDWIYNSDGTRCHSDLFYNVVSKINFKLEQVVMQYQIVQIDYNVFEVYLVVENDCEKKLIEELFVTYYEKYQAKSTFKFFFLDCLYPSEKTGKLAWFISKVKGRGSMS